MVVDGQNLEALTPTRAMRPFSTSFLDSCDCGSEKVLFENVIGDSFSPDDAHVMMLVLENDHPEWFAEHENLLADPLLASREELLAAMGSAPAPFLAGMVYQAVVMRTQLAAITGCDD